MFQINDKQIFQKVSSDAVKNIIFYGIASFIIMFINNSLNWRTFALILSVIFTIVIFMSLIPFLVAFIGGLRMIPLIIEDKKMGNNEAFEVQKWLWYGQAFQLVENVVCLFFVFKLYKLFF